MSSMSLAPRANAVRHTHGWTTSVLVHSLALGAAFAMMTNLKPEPSPDIFHWEVSMVQAPDPQPAPEPTPPTHAPQPPAPKQPPVKPARPQPVAQPVTHVVKTIQPVQQIVKQQSVTAVQPLTPVTTSTPQSVAPVSQEVQTVERTQELVPLESAETVPLATHHTAEVRESAEVKEMPVMPTQAASAVAQEVVTESQEVVTESVVAAVPTRPVVSQQIVEAPATQAIEAPPVSTPTISEVAQTAPVVQQQPSPVQEAKLLPQGGEPTETKQVPVRSAPATKADYGWLVEALWGRVEQLKHYPHLARLNRWEGKVILRAVIKDDGELLSVDIVSSSGHAILDKDAVEILRKASPLHLKHPLGKPQVMVQVPISYSLRR
ncbi:MAG TPA: TonB family protein [Nitrospiraceae bacterium]|nr:TonB family protein [Nitrospiraceae bacterium]